MPSKRAGNRANFDFFELPGIVILGGPKIPANRGGGGFLGKGETIVFRIRKKFTFEAAHQLSIAETDACKRSIHGHGYVVEVFLTAERLNKACMVCDFGLLGPCILSILKEYDHSIVMPVSLLTPDNSGFLRGLKLITLDQNPTAEVFAEIFYHVFESYLKDKVNEDVKVEKVRVHETATGWAEYDNA